MLVDLLGGLFNDLSLAFKDKFDVIAGVTYTLVVVSHPSDRQAFCLGSQPRLLNKYLYIRF